MIDSASLILPRPKAIAPLPGQLLLSAPCKLDIQCSDRRIHEAADRFVQSLPHATQSEAPALRIRQVRANEAAESYRLTTSSKGVDIASAAPAGCFYALQSLQQLVQAAQPTDHIAIPCGIIEDGPDLPLRGFMHDITRGKVPHIGTLEQLADRLALVKANQLQLYIEHAFGWSFDPDLCSSDAAITPQEVARLSRYCNDRFIELVPAVANLGHMGYFLSHPRYRHLAEIEPSGIWSQQSWPQRARGCTLDCANLQAMALVENIWTDVLAAFDSRTVNICGDEPWDLGAGKNKSRFAGDAKARAYVSHLERVHRFVSERGRRVQFWSDVIRNHLDLVSPALRDSTVLHWGYDDRADYVGTKDLIDHAMPTVVCPGTSGWKRILNAINLAERNIDNFARAAKQHGALGVLTTDWGDHGHFNVLAGSWHALALGAAKAWNTDQPTGLPFDRAFCRQFWAMPSADLLQDLRVASAIGDSVETWRVLWQSATSDADNAPLDQNLLEQSSVAARAGLDRIRSIRPGNTIADQDFAELTVALLFVDLFAKRWHRSLTPSAFRWKHDLQKATHAYADRWSHRNKPSGLADIVAALDGLQG